MGEMSLCVVCVVGLGIWSMGDSGATRSLEDQPDCVGIDRDASARSGEPEITLLSDLSGVLANVAATKAALLAGGIEADGAGFHQFAGDPNCVDCIPIVALIQPSSSPDAAVLRRVSVYRENNLHMYIQNAHVANSMSGNGYDVRVTFFDSV